NIDRLDMQFLRRSLSKHPTGVSLLPHPVQLEDVGLIREEHLQRLIGLLKASYTHLILDLSKSFSPIDITALRMSDVILVVAQLSIAALAQNLLTPPGSKASLAKVEKKRGFFSFR